MSVNNENERELPLERDNKKLNNLAETILDIEELRDHKQDKLKEIEEKLKKKGVNFDF